jgi:hypothetical protein
LRRSEDGQERGEEEKEEEEEGGLFLLPLVVGGEADAVQRRRRGASTRRKRAARTIREEEEAMGIVVVVLFVIVRGWPVGFGESAAAAAGDGEGGRELSTVCLHSNRTRAWLIQRIRASLRAYYGLDFRWLGACLRVFD